MRFSFLALLLSATFVCFSQQVILNEAQTSNSSTLADNYGEYEDWIEIYNPSNDSIDIAGLVLKDGRDTWQIPYGDSSTIIAPDEFFLLWADDEEYEGDFHTNFKLSKNGEFLGLYDSDSTTVIDSITIPALSDNTTYGKCNGEWVVFTSPTPLADNGCIDTTTYCCTDVLINEVQTVNSSTITDEQGDYDTWIEIYNPGDTETDIAGLIVTDNTNTWQIPTGDSATIISPYDYLIIWADNEESEGTLHAGFLLTDTTAEIKLYEADGTTIVDSVLLPTLVADESCGRCDDSIFKVCNVSTPLMENNCLPTEEGNTVITEEFIQYSVSENSVEVEVNDYSGESISFYLYSSDGEQVLYKKYHSRSFSVDVRCLAGGIYILNVSAGRQTFSSKIILY